MRYMSHWVLKIPWSKSSYISGLHIEHYPAYSVHKNWPEMADDSNREWPMATQTDP